MTGRLAHVSIQRKLMLLLGVTATLVVVVACGALMVLEFSSYQDRLVNEVEGLADVMSADSTAALVFDDRKAAEGVLTRLARRPHIIGASILTKEGVVFADYGSDTSPQRIRSLVPGHLFDSGRLVVVQALRLDGEDFGRLRLVSSLSEVKARFGRYVVTVLFVLVGALMPALLVASRMQRSISAPILELTQAAATISEGRTYAIRVPEGGHDEVGQLTRAFNHMLTQIESRDAALVGTQEELQQRFSDLQAEVAERKKAEEALQERDEQLRQAQKMEAVGRLAGGVAHDFNNLLTAIQGYGELAAHASDGDPTIEAHIKEVLTAAERAAGLTGQLLAFSRKQILSPKPIDVSTIVRENEKMLRRLIREDVELETRLTNGLHKVLADPGQIGQVLMNLSVNARDAMPDGGKLTIETDDTHLDDAYVALHAEVAPGDYVMLSVTDTGTGMDEATQARIFEPFFTTKGVGKGTGLGLATVYGIVHQSGGHVWVYSEPNRGTTFRVYLPALARDATALEAGTDTKHEVHGGHETLLLVEDEAQVRKLAAMTLRARGYEVLEAPHGDAALELSRQHVGGIDLVVTDVIMPKMNGREMVDRMRSDRPDLKVLFMSGYTDTAIVRQGVLDPGVQLLQKPFSSIDLARRVRDMLTATA